MKRTRNILAVIGVMLLPQCGDHSTEHFPGIGGDLPAAGASSGAAGSGTITLPDGSTGYTTTTGGYFTLSSTSTFSLSSGESFSGMTADSSSLFTFVKRDAGGITRWDIRSAALQSTGFSTVCSFLDDGNFGTSLALDSAHFYTPYSKSVRPIISRQFNRSSCSEGSLITMTSGTSPSDYYQYGRPYGRPWASDGSSLYFEVQIDSPFSRNVGLYSIAGQSFATFDPSSISLGGRKLALSDSGFLGILGIGASSGGTLWIIEDNLCKAGDSGDVLWKFTISSGSIAAVGWGHLPQSICATGSFVGFVGATTLVLESIQNVSNMPNYNQVTIYYLDVSKF